jgi:SSS family solute:Na+ symporter
MVAPLDLAIVAVYLLVTLAIGFSVYRTNRSFDDFFVAGRTMSTPLLVCTLMSTFYGVDVLFGTSELAYNEGVVAWFSYSRPMYVLLLVAAFVVAPKIHGAGFRTLPDILALHYGRPTQVVGACASFVYALPSLGLFGLGHVFSVLFGWEPWIGALLFGGVALLYTLVGGLMADALTDTIQFVMMCVTLAIAVPLILSEVGGFASLETVRGPEYFEPLGTIPVWLVLVYASTALVVFVEPAFYQRIFAARSAAEVRNAMVAGIVLWAAYDWCVTAGGMLAAGAVGQGLLPADLHPDQALLQVVVHGLPIGLTGLFLAGVLAAEMSTVDSYCLVAGGNVAYDIYRPLFRPAAGDRELVRWTQLGTILSWVIGFGIAFAFERILSLWVFLSTILTATVLVPVMAGLFWKGRKTPLAGLLSSLTGLASSLVYYVAVYWFGVFDEEFATYIWISGTVELWQEYAMLISVPLSLAAFVAGSVIARMADGDER